MSSGLFDIVLPIYINRNFQIPMTIKCIDLIRKFSPSANLIIVETGSDFEDFADEHYSVDEPLTYAKKVNIGLKKSRSSHVVVASNDIYVVEGYYEALMKCFRDDKCGVATIASDQFKEGPRDLIEEGFFGGFWMVSRKCLEDVGYLDEEFINAFEDSDYWIRTLLAGYKILINRSCVVHHVQSQTIMHDPNHLDNFVFGRKRFKQKHGNCGLPLYERLK